MKKQEPAIGYRPSEEVKKIFEEVCSGSASISRGQLIEVSMQFLISQGKERMKEIITNYLLGNFDSLEVKKGHLRKAA